MQPDLRLGTSAATVANRIGSTAVLEYRTTETIPPLGAMLPSPARLCRPRSPQTARTPAETPGLFHERRRNPERAGLSAGGNWIRTSRSWMQVEQLQRRNFIAKHACPYQTPVALIAQTGSIPISPGSSYGTLIDISS